MKRSKWKGLFTRVDNIQNKRTTQKKIPRNSGIVPKYIGRTFLVHNGKAYKNVLILKEMLGHKFGEFVRTRANFEYKKKKKKRKKYHSKTN